MNTHLIKYTHHAIEELTKHLLLSEFKMYRLPDNSVLVFVPTELVGYFDYSVHVVLKKIEAKYMHKLNLDIVERYRGDDSTYVRLIEQMEENGKIWCYKAVLPNRKGRAYRSLIADIWPKLALRYDYHVTTVAPSTKAILASNNPFDAMTIARTIAGPKITTLMGGFGTPLGQKVLLTYFNVQEEKVLQLNSRDLNQPDSSLVYESPDNTIALVDYTPWAGSTWDTSGPEDL